MNWLEIFLVWFAGLVNGIVFTALIVFHIGNKALASSKKKLTDLADSLPKGGTIDETLYALIEPRMNRIKEIAKLQMDLQGATDGPQRNAMDGKYKNGLMAQIKQLEEEKVTILNSILNDGFDPPVNVLKEDGTTELTKLSTFLAGYSSDAVGKPSEPGPVRNVGKFVIHKGGKDDSGNTTH